eukprot:754589-Hanusia_phi.AAC.1
MMKAAEKVVVLEGNPRGRQVVLIDDIIITGSTMIRVIPLLSFLPPPSFVLSLSCPSCFCILSSDKTQCAELLQSLGAVSINVYVTHANFTGQPHTSALAPFILPLILLPFKPERHLLLPHSLLPTLCLLVPSLTHLANLTCLISSLPSAHFSSENSWKSFTTGLFDKVWVTDRWGKATDPPPPLSSHCQRLDFLAAARLWPRCWRRRALPLRSSSLASSPPDHHADRVACSSLGADTG